MITTLVLSLSTASGARPAAQAPQISTEAAAHLTEIVSVLQRQWLHRRDMDWDVFQQRVLQRAGAAQTIPDTYDAIRLALTLLADRHTYYVTASGDYINNPQSPTEANGDCASSPVDTPALPSDIGYVRMQLDPATSPEAIQDALRRGDGANTVGWIVDLRDNRRGNTWPALVGIGSLLGEGTSGFFIDAADLATPWGYTNGRAWLGRPDNDLAFLDAPYKLLAPGPRVAVLTDASVAGPGEAVAIAFRARPNTRTFGTPTCGLSTAVAQFRLRRGGQLGVVTAVMADRTKTKYGRAIPPDEMATDTAEIFRRVLAWLHQP